MERYQLLIDLAVWILGLGISITSLFAMLLWIIGKRDAIQKKRDNEQKELEKIIVEKALQIQANDKLKEEMKTLEDENKKLRQQQKAISEEIKKINEKQTTGKPQVKKSHQE